MSFSLRTIINKARARIVALIKAYVNGLKTKLLESKLH